MEVDLRRREKEKRTLHWFVRGKQQNVFITGVPDRVEFAVCYFIHFFVHVYSFNSLLISIQICTLAKDNSIEFMRLEELEEPGVREVYGRGYGWSKEEEGGGGEEEEEEDTEEGEEEGEEEE